MKLGLVAAGAVALVAAGGEGGGRVEGIERDGFVIGMQCCVEPWSMHASEVVMHGVRLL
jgi:hypothetical protein